MNFKCILKKGFTLIEMMLIIAVLAVILLFVMRNIQAKQHQDSLDNTILQINNWLQAGTAYYAGNNRTWPETTADVRNAGYMPNTADCSPWPWLSGSPSDKCQGLFSQYFITSKKTDNMFVVSLILPNAGIAQELQGGLANSWITKGTQLNAAIPIPGGSNMWSNVGWIVSAGLVDANAHDINKNGKIDVGGGKDGTMLYLPKCPPNYAGHLITAPQWYTTDSTLGVSYNMQTMLSSSVVLRDGQNQAYVQMKQNNGSGSNQTHIFFMTFCLPVGNWTTDNVLYGTPMGQCDYHWDQYVKGTTSGGQESCYNLANPPAPPPPAGTTLFIKGHW